MMATTKKFSWDSYVENFVGVRQSEDIKEARRVYKFELNPSQQYTLVEELVNTRSVELCRAYKNVVSLHTGFGFRTNAKNKKKSKNNIPTVIFLVKEKWKKNKSNTEDTDKIPKLLFAYFNVGIKRKLCAIPTDVECAKERTKGRVDNSAGINIIPSERADPERPGTITCALQRSNFPEETFIMSCRHVFSLSVFYHPSKLSNSSVVSRNNIFEYAKTINVKGRLVNGVRLSLDAQLSLVNNPKKLRTALNNIHFTDYARTIDDIPKHSPYWIITSRGSLAVNFQQHWKPGPGLSYGLSDLSDVVHAEVIESVFKGSATTINGDSGSPVTTEKNGGKLLGMHFYRYQNTNSSLFIPAWILFDAKNYKKTVSSENWTILNADELQTEPLPLSFGEITNNYISKLTTNRNFNGSVSWKLTSKGICIDNAKPEITSGKPSTVQRIWDDFGSHIQRSATEFDVPVELIIATICTESGGDPFAMREEPGYKSDNQTPNRISVGLMQTLISTAREALDNNTIHREKLLSADFSIRAGTAYIAQQRIWTQYDPPKVACAYNAGSIRTNDSVDNRWRMRQFPIGTNHHADRFIRWFNDCFHFFRKENIVPEKSFLRDFS
jgi:hypothetical protein